MPTYIFRYRLIPPEPPTLAVPVTASDAGGSTALGGRQGPPAGQGRTLGPCPDVEEWADLPPFS
jgi:hypothetical protein